MSSKASVSLVLLQLLPFQVLADKSEHSCRLAKQHHVGVTTVEVFSPSSSLGFLTGPGFELASSGSAKMVSLALYRLSYADNLFWLV